MSKTTEGVACIIPACNESDRIGDTIQAVFAIPAISDLLVIDDGSLDDTAKQSKRTGARVIQLRKNHGKGFCLEQGLSRVSGRWVLFLDADIGSSAVQMAKVIGAAQERDLDLAIASPSLQKAGLGIVQKLSRLVLWLGTNKNLRTPLSGQRVLKKEVAQMLLPFPAGFGVETSMNIKAFRMGLRLEEIPVSLTHRHTGKNLSGFLHRSRQAKDILLSFLQECLLS